MLRIRPAGVERMRMRMQMRMQMPKPMPLPMRMGMRMRMRVLLPLLAACWLCSSGAQAKQASNAARQFGGQNFGNALGNGPLPGFGAGGIGVGGGGGGYAPPGCPLCDASVYSYCSHKVIHDACCCDFPALQQQQQLRPPQCIYYDCSLLYAKSCYEHSLIKNCCCNSPY